jgi:hypothetical protein
MSALKPNIGSNPSPLQAGRYLLALLIPFLFLGTASHVLIELVFHKHQESHWWLTEEENKALEKESIRESEAESKPKDASDGGDSDDWIALPAFHHLITASASHTTFYLTGFCLPFALIKSYFPPLYLTNHCILE